MIGAGIYYMTWVLKDKTCLTICLGGEHSSYYCISISSTNTGWKVEQEVYKLNLRGCILAVIGRALSSLSCRIYGKYSFDDGISTALVALGLGAPWQGDMEIPVIASMLRSILT